MTLGDEFKRLELARLREKIALMLAPQLIMDSDLEHGIRDAVKGADLLIAELNKEPK